MATIELWEFAGRSLVRPVFIETGTGEGDTLACAAAAGFRLCHSIDVHRGNAALARLRFAADFRVHIHHGSSPDVLPLVMVDVPTTFWLDAHYRACGDGEMDPRHGQCPLLAELAAIVAVQWTEQPVILIDDAALFERPWADEFGEHFDIEQWPEREQIDARLPGHEITEQGGILYCMPRE